MEISIAYCTDERYAKIMTISIVSVCETNKNINKITFYCLHNGLSSRTQEMITEIVESYARKVVFINVSNICEKRRFWNPDRDTMFSRFFIPDLIEKDKVLYLDCDLIVNDSLEQLWKMETAGYYHLVVQDTSRKRARLEITKGREIKYFNSGVMVINNHEWINDDLFELMRNSEKKYTYESVFPDQRPLNEVTINKAKIIHPKFNLTPEFWRYSYRQLIKLMETEEFYSEQEVKEAIENPVIIHFSGRSIDRPWFTNCKNIYKEKYRTIMVKNDYTNFPLWNDSAINVMKWIVKYRLPFSLQMMISRNK